MERSEVSIVGGKEGGWGVEGRRLNFPCILSTILPNVVGQMTIKRKVTISNLVPDHFQSVADSPAAVGFVGT
jgi:hypothetical protein